MLALTYVFTHSQGRQSVGLCPLEHTGSEFCYRERDIESCVEIMKQNHNSKGIVSSQAVNRQMSLEQHLQTMRESDHMAHVLQESLEELDKQLTTYLTDRVDALRLPQEAQVSMSFMSVGAASPPLFIGNSIPYLPLSIVVTGRR